jgi:membrane protein DedA with SNARE-associated domain
VFQLPALLGIILKYRYVALFPLACLEGPILALLIGFLVHQGYFSFIPALFIMILGDFIPDSIYYLIGRFSNKEKLIKKYKNSSPLIFGHLLFLENMWQKHPLKTMFISKLAYGLSTPLLISSGIVKMPYKKFILQAFIVTIAQYGIIMTIGYSLSSSYLSATGYIKNIGIFIAIAIVIFIIIYTLMQKYVKKQIIILEKEEKK